MSETMPEKFDENLTPEEKERMERLARGAEKILSQEAGEEIDFIERDFGNIFKSPQYIKEMFSIFEKKFGWPENKSWAMVRILRHALDELYYRLSFRAVDEFNPHPEGQTRDTQRILLDIVAKDYGAEVLADVAPLVDMYVKKAQEIIREKKKSTGDGEEQTS